MYNQMEDKRRESAYLKLYRTLREEIIRGSYAFGSRLPSKRTLAADAGVSVITVEHAYDILREEGYIESREKSGYFVAYRSEESFAMPERQRPAPLPPERPVEDEFPFSVLARTMRRVLSDYGERILTKSPNQGCEELRRAIADYLDRTRGIRVGSGQVIIGSGAEYLYGTVVRMLGRNRVYGLENPSYEKIRRVYQASGARCDFLKLGPEGIRSEELRRTKATVLHVTPFRSFPSGVTASASKRAEYVRFARERGGFIVEDDFDSEFTRSSKAEETVFSLAPDGLVLYMNTFSKTVAPSFRAGYLVLPETLLPLYRENNGFFACTVPVFEQYVLAELIRSGDFERHINRVRRRRRQEMREE